MALEEEEEQGEEEEEEREEWAAGRGPDPDSRRAHSWQALARTGPQRLPFSSRLPPLARPLPLLLPPPSLDVGCSPQGPDGDGEAPRGRRGRMSRAGEGRPAGRKLRPQPRRGRGSGPGPGVRGECAPRPRVPLSWPTRVG